MHQSMYCLIDHLTTMALTILHSQSGCTSHCNIIYREEFKCTNVASFVDVPKALHPWVTAEKTNHPLVNVFGAFLYGAC